MWATVFLLTEVLLVVLCALGLVAVGNARLQSRFGIARDGVRVGKKAPTWQATDLSGRLHTGPPQEKPQLLIFADQDLQAFPDLIRGMNRLLESPANLEVLVIASAPRDICLLSSTNLKLQVPLIPAAHSLYWQFRIRVRPFVHIVDQENVVRSVGLANTDADLRRLLDAAAEYARKSRTAANALER
jgi:hypothetical protein